MVGDVALLQTGQLQSWSFAGSYQNADPTALTLKVFDGSGQETDHTYPSGDGVVVRDALGQFHALISLTKAGIWTYQWVASGAVVGTWDGQFDVRAALS